MDDWSPGFCLWFTVLGVASRVHEPRGARARGVPAAGTPRRRPLSTSSIGLLASMSGGGPSANRESQDEAQVHVWRVAEEWRVTEAVERAMD